MAFDSRLPFTVLNAATPVPSNVSKLVTVDRPNTTGQPYAPANQSYTNWNAFTLQPVGTVGNESRAQLHGPHQRSMDFSLFKDFQLRESMKLQFRAEAYNITNTENFGQPQVNVSKWTSKSAGASPTNAGGFGQITASNLCLNPRLFQLALKLIF